MQISAARALIETYLQTNWTVTPIQWQNLEGSSLNSPSMQILEFGEEDYLAADFEILNSKTITVPAHCIRYSGLLVFSICVKQGKGAGLTDRYGDSLISLFENKTLGDYPSNIRIRTIAGSTIYRTETGWYVNLMNFPFYFNRFISNP